MDIDDYCNGTAYIVLPRDVFSDENYFNNLLAFLKLPKDTHIIKINVNKQYQYDFNIIPQNYSGM